MTSNSGVPVHRYATDRHFQVWAYIVGHAQLLLWSVKRDGQTTRIDVLFKGVVTIDIPTSLKGLRIERQGERYHLAGQGWRGHIVALACFYAEDDGEHSDPSPFEHSF